MARHRPTLPFPLHLMLKSQLHTGLFLSKPSMRPPICQSTLQQGSACPLHQGRLLLHLRSVGRSLLRLHLVRTGR
jgi:hypothetical protein